MPRIISKPCSHTRTHEANEKLSLLECGKLVPLLVPLFQSIIEIQAYSARSSLHRIVALGKH